jgi:hypothetical protein
MCVHGGTVALFVSNLKRSLTKADCINTEPLEPTLAIFAGQDCFFCKAASPLNAGISAVTIISNRAGIAVASCIVLLEDLVLLLDIIY